MNDTPLSGDDMPMSEATRELGDHVRFVKEVDWKKVREWVAQGADLHQYQRELKKVCDQKRRLYLPLLEQVAESGDLNAIPFLLAQGLDPEENPEGLGNAIHLVIFRHPPEDVAIAIQILIDYGTNPNHLLRFRQCSALSQLCTHLDGGLDERVRGLIDNGAKVDDVSRRLIEQRQWRFNAQDPWWQACCERWRRAEQFIKAPSREAISPQLVYDLSNLGRLDALNQYSLWEGNAAAFQHILTQIAPYLVQDILQCCPSALALQANGAPHSLVFGGKQHEMVVYPPKPPDIGKF